MNISAWVANTKGEHAVRLQTDGREHALTIPPKPDGYGSGTNGGELLFLALATCYCNDIYREARKRGTAVERVEVEVRGEFTSEGGAVQDVTYRASVHAYAPREQILELMSHTDTVAEVQNTVRVPCPVTLAGCDAHEL